MRKIVILILSVFLVSGCQKSEYHKLITKAKASGIQNDSLIVGIHFGMSSKEFFTHCWEEHKKGTITNSVSNTNIRMELDEYHPKLAVDFYPWFHDDAIWKMPLNFYFDDFSQWNKDLGEDSLSYYTWKVINDWYGDDFIEVVRERAIGDLTYRIAAEGNRKVMVMPNEINKITVELIDLNQETSALEAQKALKEKK